MQSTPSSTGAAPPGGPCAPPGGDNEPSEPPLGPAGGLVFALDEAGGPDALHGADEVDAGVGPEEERVERWAVEAS